MLKINPALCFKPADLIKFMQQNTVDSTLTQEIAAALTMRLFFEKVLGWKDYFIYFEPKNSKQTELLESIGKTISFADLPEFIEVNTEQSSERDFYFVCKDVNPADVYPVQTKIFGIGLDPDTVTEKLIEYFEGLQKKYGKTETALLLHFRSRGTLQPKPLTTWLNENSFPFREVEVMTLRPDGGPTLCQLYPNDGNMHCFDFSREDMLAIEA